MESSAWKTLEPVLDASLLAELRAREEAADVEEIQDLFGEDEAWILHLWMKGFVICFLDKED